MLALCIFKLPVGKLAEKWSDEENENQTLVRLLI